MTAVSVASSAPLQRQANPPGKTNSVIEQAVGGEHAEGLAWLQFQDSTISVCKSRTSASQGRSINRLASWRVDNGWLCVRDIWQSNDRAMSVSTDKRISGFLITVLLMLLQT